MQFDYDSSPVRGAVIGAAIVAVVSLVLPVTLLQLIGLSFAAGPAVWAYIQWRRNKHGVCLNERDLVIELPAIGRSKHIPYVDILGCASTADQGLIVAYIRRSQQPTDSGDYPAVSRVALAQARPRTGIRRAVINTPRLKDIQGCLAALAQYQLQNPPGLAEQFSENMLRSLAVRRNRRNVILFVLAVLATPIYVIVISRLVAIFH